MENSDKDQLIWQTAKARVGFKKKVIVYIVCNIFFWGMWFFTKNQADVDTLYPWPIWVTLGWGIGIAMNYIKAYHTDTDAVQREYEKLKGNRN